MSKTKVYNRIARIYDVLDFPFEHGRYRPIRKHMLSGLGGRILDAGVGTGLSMAFYPDGAQVTGIDVSKDMLGRAEKRRDDLNKQVDLLV